MLRTEKAAATTGTCLWNLARLNALMMSMMGGRARSAVQPLGSRTASMQSCGSPNPAFETSGSGCAWAPGVSSSMHNTC